MKRTLVLLLPVVLLFASLAAPAWAGSIEDGNKALDAKAWEKAADHFRKALEKDAANADAAIGLARAAIGGTLTEAYFEAEEVLHAAIARNPKRRDTRRALGDVFLASAKNKVTDPKSMEFTFKDAKATFEKLVEEDKKDEAAAVGLAQALYNLAAFDEAIGVLDAFTSKSKSDGSALYWKGQILYTKAVDAYRASGQLDETVKGDFRKAQGAYLAATQADPKAFDAWMQLGYAGQYLGETDEAQKAYEKAMDLAPQSLAPLRGIEALYYYRAKDYPAALVALQKAHPDNVPVHFFLGFQALQAKKYDEAVKSLTAFEKKAKEPGMVWAILAQAYAGKGDEDKAARLFDKALEHNPNDTVAADAIDQRLRKKFLGKVMSSPKAALEMAQAYESLFEKAPNNVWVRNNLAFVLREAVTKHQGNAKWKPVLDACVKVYEDATQLSEQHLGGGREANTAYPTRHSYAGVINDTGLMFHYYPSIRDIEKAEDFYLRALELTEDGYQDAFTNLEKIYRAQQRWDELYELATACAENLKLTDGKPNPTARAYARGVAARLEQEGKVGGD